MRNRIHFRRAAAAVGLVLLAACGPKAPSDQQTGALVQARCAACHDLTRVERAGYDRPGWRNTIAMMVNMGAQVSPTEADQISAYLAARYPEKPRPAAVIVPGSVRVGFREWTVPTAGSRPHDPLATPDGMVWYTGQMANVLGRLDPRTGQIKEFRLPPQSGPHGLIADASGDIWYTANFGGYIGRLDPRTGAVTRFPMPDPAAKDPHTLLFEPKGRSIIFTVQGADRVGRLDPASGKITLAHVPTRKANPYGIAFDSKGTPFFDEFGSNKIGRLNPDTLAIVEFPLPDPKSRPRRIAITQDDAVWFTDYSQGRLGRLDAKTGRVTEWPSPSGKDSQPYAITARNGVLWYVESNTKPNALVRFDPAMGKFQSWPIPGGGGVVRNMVNTPSGGLAFPESGVNKIAVATISGG